MQDEEQAVEIEDENARNSKGRRIQVEVTPAVNDTPSIQDHANANGSTSTNGAYSETDGADASYAHVAAVPRDEKDVAAVAVVVVP